MASTSDILIVAEVGGKVGWGHLSRASKLYHILLPYFDVELAVVNRQSWTDSQLEQQFSLKGATAKLLISDGLSLKALISNKVKYESLISLSYLSDVNDEADLVVAPALNGLANDPKIYTGLNAILCNIPDDDQLIKQDVHDESNIEIGVCLGGADVDCLGPSMVSYINEHGHSARLFSPSKKSNNSFECFLQRKLVKGEVNKFPYYDLKDCRVTVTQGGLTAVELSLLGMPIIIRTRKGFGDAYHFLKDKNYAVTADLNDPKEIAKLAVRLCEDEEWVRKTRYEGIKLKSTIDESYWLNLSHGFINGERNYA